MSVATRDFHNRWSRSPLAVAAGLDILGAACFLLAQQLIFSEPRGRPAKGFFDELPPALLMLSVALFWTAGGVVSAVSLHRTPLVSRTGRWAVRLMVFNICLIPVLGLITGLSSLLGHSLPEGWGQPLMPIWMLTVVASTVLGLVSSSERKRGALLIPLILGASTLTFLLGELLSSH